MTSKALGLGLTISVRLLITILWVEDAVERGGAGMESCYGGEVED